MAQDRTRASFELLLNISRELATTLELRTVLARVLSLSTSNVGAERGSLIVLNEAEAPVDAAIVIGDQIVHPTLAELQGILDHGLAGWVASHREAALINDTSQDERWAQRPDDATERTGRKSALCVPLLAREQLVGVLTIVHAKTHFFTPDHLALIQAIADVAGIAIRNAHLYDSVQAAQRRYRELFEDSIDPILVTDWNGSILEANRQASANSGRTQTELAGKIVTELFSVNWDLVGQKYERLSSGETIRYESQLNRTEGGPLPIEVYVRQINFGSTSTLQWILRDISERKELDSLRDDLSAMIYHDLRSPLSNIISALDILNSFLPEESVTTIQPILSIASRSTDRLQRLISSLLDINRLEAGQPITNKRPLEPGLLAEEAAEVVRPLTESKQQSLAVQIESNLPNIEADPDMLRRVLINLIENAVKFTPVGGQIEVSCSSEPDFIRFQVKDSGAGIAEEAREAIFEKFTRLQAERFPKGFGLGLAFCRLAVRAHGGRIWVESQVGKGSQFIFNVPVATPA